MTNDYTPETSATQSGRAELDEIRREGPRREAAAAREHAKIRAAEDALSQPNQGATVTPGTNRPAGGGS